MAGKLIYFSGLQLMSYRLADVGRENLKNLIGGHLIMSPGERRPHRRWQETNLEQADVSQTDL